LAFLALLAPLAVNQMTELDRYLDRYFVNAECFARSCGIELDELRDLIRRRLVPEPSYVVRDETLRSFVFGELPAPQSTSGEYFRPEMSTWTVDVRHDVATQGIEGAGERARRKFTDAFSAALRTMNATVYRMRDAFDDAGEPIASGLTPRLDSAWEHFLRGTFGLCVANPASVLEIARKEVLQERLTTLTENGAKIGFAAGEVPAFRDLIAAYASASMPFSPVEYARSSRKRLVDDLRARL
jgi:hypothetical protein